MLVLGLDTASSVVSVAVHDGTAVLAARAGAPSPRHAELLAPLIEEVLEEAGHAPADLTAIAAGTGPGPFTGLRVGLVSARVLGLALGVPVLGVGSLDALAAGALRAGLEAGPRQEFVVATDARRREVYWARYRADGTSARRLDGPSVGAAADVPRDDLPVGGRGAELYPEALGAAHAPLDPDAADVAALAALALAAGTPLPPPEPQYLRRPDAQVPGAPKRVRP